MINDSKGNSLVESPHIRHNFSKELLPVYEYLKGSPGFSEFPFEHLSMVRDRINKEYNQSATSNNFFTEDYDYNSVICPYIGQSCIKSKCMAYATVDVRFFPYSFQEPKPNLVAECTICFQPGSLPNRAYK